MERTEGSTSSDGETENVAVTNIASNGNHHHLNHHPQQGGASMAPLQHPNPKTYEWALKMAAQGGRAGKINS